MKEPPVPQKNDALNALINVEQHPEAVVVRIKAEKIEEYNVQEVQDAMSLAIAEVSPKPVVLELSGVIFLQSLALGALLRILTGCRSVKDAAAAFHAAAKKKLMESDSVKGGDSNNSNEIHAGRVRPRRTQLST